MKNKLMKTYKQFNQSRRKKTLVQRFFSVFLPEAVYRNTKIEHPKTSRKEVFSFLK